MTRTIPCQYCKQRRRKCERLNEIEPCQRCIKMNKKCLPQGCIEEISKDEQEQEQEQLELEAMHQQVTDLENELKNLEIGFKHQRSLVKKEPSWDIHFVNGELRLATEIKSIEERLLYGESVIRYLSPFGKTFGTTLLKFERNNPGFIKATRSLMSKFDVKKHEQYILSISQKFLIGIEQPKMILNLLVELFFNCMNNNLPIIHEPSFREYYSKLNNPLNDAVTLAICASSSISTCKHSIFNSEKKRFIGEYFYKRAMDKLLDMFDEPDKALDSLIVINVLQLFMMTTLRLSDCKRWSTIAVILSNNIKKENPGCLNGDSTLPLLTRIKYATIHRNSVFSECIDAMVNFVLNNRKDEIIQTKVKFDILPDETDSVKNLIDMANHALLLTVHPTAILVVTQARNMAAGEIAELNFDQIIQFEAVVSTWWHQLPDHLKLCNEPYNCTAAIIKSSNDLSKLLMICYLYTITLSIQECLIEPKYKVGLENVHSTVRDRATHLAMHSANMILLLSEKLETMDSICHSPARLLIRSIDSLVTIVQAKNEMLARQAKEKLTQYMSVLKKNIPIDHQVSLSVSPFSNISISADHGASSVAELYDNYSLPGEAFAYDMINSTVNIIIQKAEQSRSP